MIERMSEVFTSFCSRSNIPLCESSLTSCSKCCLVILPLKVISAKPVPSKYAASFTQTRVSPGFNLFLVFLFHYESQRKTKMENMRVNREKYLIHSDVKHVNEFFVLNLRQERKPGATSNKDFKYLLTCDKVYPLWC